MRIALSDFMWRRSEAKSSELWTLTVLLSDSALPGQALWHCACPFTFSSSVINFLIKIIIVPIHILPVVIK